VRVGTRLSVAVGLPVVLLVASLLYHVRTLRESVSTSFELSELSDRVFLSSSTKLNLLNQLEENGEKYWITGDSGYLARFEELQVSFRESVEALKRLPLTTAEAEQLEALSATWLRFVPVARWIEAGPDAVEEAIAAELLAELRDHLTALRWQVRLVSDASQRAMSERLELSSVRAVRGERLALAAALASLLLSLLISTAIVRSIAGALRRLKEGTQAVAGGDFEHRLPIESRDEFAELARDFNVMTRRLGELDETKKRFLSSVSHDLKTPLASMQETTRILLDEVPGPVTANQSHLLALSHQSGMRLSSMIADLLDLSSMEAGAFSLQREVHDIGALVRQSVDQLEPLAMERRIRLLTEFPDRALQVWCDGTRMIQVLVNLISNAVKFSPIGADVIVSAHRFVAQEGVVAKGNGTVANLDTEGPDSAVICVRDSGPGIAVQDRDLVFHRFVQTETGKSVRGRGVGLGLAICREIVTAHGGRIWVEEGSGGGSRFVVILPDAVPSPEPVLVAPSVAATYT
jgi:signal transduction histidine kinase